MSLNGKIVFITGASAGIGAATALAFAAEGARLLLAARRAGKLAEVASRALDLGAPAVHSIDLDVRQYRAVQDAVLGGGGFGLGLGPGFAGLVEIDEVSHQARPRSAWP